MSASAPQRHHPARRVLQLATALTDSPAYAPSRDVNDNGPAGTADQAGPLLDRELSWLAFNARVLALAQDERTPLLERVRFAAIFASNLDEFFMVRVADLKRKLAAEQDADSRRDTHPTELPPHAGRARWADERSRTRTGRQLAAVLDKAAELAGTHATLFADTLLPALRDAGIDVLRWDQLDAREKQELTHQFHTQLAAGLTPLAFDSAHPFPTISGLSLNLAVLVTDPQTTLTSFARVKVPPLLPRLLPIGNDRFVPVEDVILAHLGELFTGMTIESAHAFRVTRNADVEVDDEDTDNLIDALERELARRRFGPAVRLEVEDDVDPRLLALLVRELEVDDQDVHRLPGMLDLTALMELADLDRPEHKFVPAVTATHPALAHVTCPEEFFTAVRAGDILLHHPYQRFDTSAQALLEHAADDEHVVAIKQTLYRTSGDSPVIDALMSAAKAGKQVVVLVEVKARFDEEANIGWARALEQAGCHVVYGLVGLKTHSKLCLVVRRENGQLVRYTHIGTGNYNPRTARLYEDLGVLTADDQVGAEVGALFNSLTGYARPGGYQRLLVAPDHLRDQLTAKIADAADAARAGRVAAIRWKVNHLTDPDVITALYRASDAGVTVSLVVRGMCTLRPGVPGLSDNITVRSVLGRYLEHSRIYTFEIDGQTEVWTGSADAMHRNLDRRVEALVCTRGAVSTQLLDLLELLGAPDIARFDLDGDGTWTRRSGPQYRDVQETLLARNTAQRHTVAG